METVDLKPCSCSMRGDPYKAPEQHGYGCPWRERRLVEDTGVCDARSGRSSCWFKQNHDGRHSYEPTDTPAAPIDAETYTNSLERDSMALRARIAELTDKLAAAKRERDELFTRVNAKDCSQYHTTDAVLEEKAKREAAEQRCKALEAELAELKAPGQSDHYETMTLDDWRELVRVQGVTIAKMREHSDALEAAVQAALDWIVPVYDGLIGGLDDITRSVGAKVKRSLPVDQHPTVVQLRAALGKPTPPADVIAKVEKTEGDQFAQLPAVDKSKDLPDKEAL